MAIPILSLIGTAFSTIGTLAGSWLQRKKIKAEGKIKIEVAKVQGQVRHAQTMLEGDQQYDIVAAKGMAASLKDEFWSLIFGGILICAFLPWTQPYVKEGFIFLKEFTPVWFEWCLIGIIVASFGLKSWAGWRK